MTRLGTDGDGVVVVVDEPSEDLLGGLLIGLGVRRAPDPPFFPGEVNGLVANLVYRLRSLGDGGERETEL